MHSSECCHYVYNFLTFRHGDFIVYRHIVVFELFLSILRLVTLAMTINEILLLHSVPRWHESISVSQTHLVA